MAKNIKFEINGIVHAAAITTMDEKAIKKIRKNLDTDFNMETENETLSYFECKADILYTEGFCGYDFNLVITVYDTNIETGENNIIEVKTYDIKTLINTGKAKYRMNIAEKGMDKDYLYLIACTKENSQIWTSEIKINDEHFDPSKVTVNITDFENPHTQLPTFIIEGLKYNGIDIDFERDVEIEVVTKHYDFIRFNSGRSKNRYERVKLQDVLRDNFKAIKTLNENSQFDGDRFKRFYTKRTLIM